MNMIYNFVTFGKYTSLNCLEKPFLLCRDLQQIDKVCLCKQRWKIYLFLSTCPCQNLASPTGSLWPRWFTVTGLVILIIVKTCSLFSSCLCFCLLKHTKILPMLLATLLISCLFYKIIVSYSTQCVSRIIMITRWLEAVDWICSSVRDQWLNNVTLDIGRSKQNEYFPETNMTSSPENFEYCFMD